MHYFELFGIPVSFSPNLQLVKQQFYVLSRKYHPDFFANSSEEEKNAMLQMSSMVNKAYKTLTNREATIAYVLELNGLLAEGEKYQLSPDFLMEVMELNENLADANGDADVKQQVINQIESLEKELYATVETIFESDSATDYTQEALLQVKDYYFKKKYLDKILADIDL